MHTPLLDRLLTEAAIAERLHVAERAAIVAAAHDSPPLTASLLAWFGHRLTVLGSSLEATAARRNHAASFLLTGDRCAECAT